MESKSLQATEDRGAEGAQHPRITLDFMKSQIANVFWIDGGTLAKHATYEEHQTKVQLPHRDVFTICMLELKNGFRVVGKSAPMSPENFDARKGREFAFDECVRQLWPLYAFAQLENTHRG